VEHSLGDKESNTMERLRDGVQLADMNTEILLWKSMTNSESHENWYFEPPHAFKCTREKIGTLYGYSRVQG
jgi:hypothetical protein